MRPAENNAHRADVVVGGAVVVVAVARDRVMEMGKTLAGT
jgi:hypothetical protein